MSIRSLFLCLILCMAVSYVTNARDYSVQPGDTIMKIAASELGDAARWREIVELNNLDTPYVIKVGQCLKLPDTPGVQNIEETTQPDSLAEEPPPPQQQAIPTWVWAIISWVVFFLVSALSLKIGCWFSLVEASFGRCLIYAIVSSLVFVLIFSGVIGLGYAAIKGSVPWFSVPIAAVILMGSYLAGMIIFMKRLFDCKWRSVITILVMTTFIGNTVGTLLILGVSLCIPAAMNPEPLEALVDYMMTSWKQP